ncbi:MAG TPA: hypothetical protein VF535_11575 [Allosphingosinicella sp.]|jgi:hypothetical protein
MNIRDAKVIKLTLASGIAVWASAGLAQPQAELNNGSIPTSVTATTVVPAVNTSAGNTVSATPGTSPVSSPQAPAGAQFVQAGQPPAAPAPAVAPPATPTVVLPGRPVGDTTALVMIALLGLVGLIFLGIIATRLAAANWALADALSEDVVVPVFDATTGAPIMAGAVQATASKLVPSTSRLIALMGLFAILLLYTGFGAAVLYYFATGQVLPPQIGEVRSFLYAGLTLFAPYIVNKFSDVFKVGK